MITILALTTLLSSASTHMVYKEGLLNLIQEAGQLDGCPTCHGASDHDPFMKGSCDVQDQPYSNAAQEAHSYVYSGGYLDPKDPGMCLPKSGSVCGDQNGWDGKLDYTLEESHTKWGFGVDKVDEDGNIELNMMFNQDHGGVYQLFLCGDNSVDCIKGENRMKVVSVKSDTNQMRVSASGYLMIGRNEPANTHTAKVVAKIHEHDCVKSGACSVISHWAPFNKGKEFAWFDCISVNTKDAKNIKPRGNIPNVPIPTYGPSPPGPSPGPPGPSPGPPSPGYAQYNCPDNYPQQWLKDGKDGGFCWWPASSPLVDVPGYNKEQCFSAAAKFSWCDPKNPHPAPPASADNCPAHVNYTKFAIKGVKGFCYLPESKPFVHMGNGFNRTLCYQQPKYGFKWCNITNPHHKPSPTPPSPSPTPPSPSPTPPSPSPKPVPGPKVPEYHCPKGDKAIGEPNKKAMGWMQADKLVNGNWTTKYGGQTIDVYQCQNGHTCGGDDAGICRGSYDSQDRSYTKGENNPFWVPDNLGKDGECDQDKNTLLGGQVVCNFKPGCFYNNLKGHCDTCLVPESEGGCKVKSSKLRGSH